jgi:hypothetical protein
MVQVALSILKPAGSVGVTVQLAIGCTGAPTLPAGLSIDSATCTISGPPTEVRARTVYTVTAKNATVPLIVQVVLLILKPAGSVGVAVQLAIAPPELLKVMLVMAEPIVATWSVALIAVVGFTITDITFGNSAGAIVSCTVAPTLPAGLSIDGATCTISGTPTKMRALNIYTVTAKDAKDNTTQASW